MKNNFLVLIVLLIIGCDPIDNKLKVTNNSNERIYYILNCGELSKLYFPDSENNEVELTYLNFVEELGIKSSKSEIITGAGNAWERYIDACPNGEISFYLFHIDTLKKYKWKEVVDNKLYKKKQFSTSDLRKVKWNITITSG